MGKVVDFDLKVFLEGHTKKIKEVELNHVNDYMYIGYLLYEIREFNYFEVSGYNSVSDYAEKELQFDKSYTSRLIKLCESFSKRTKSGSPSMYLDKYYEGFNKSQLIELLRVPDEYKHLVKKDMTIKEIRELVKSKKEKVATSQLKIEGEEKEENNLKELKCANCGKTYFVDDKVKTQWIIINNKAVASCCFKFVYDIDLVKEHQ